MKKNIRNRIFYIHGGPGLNSLVESILLGPALQAKGIDAFFFNEHSPNDFSDLCSQIDREFFRLGSSNVHLLAHSFAVFPVLHLLQTKASLISKITLISPSPDLPAAYENILNLAQADFEKLHLADLTQQLKQHRALSKSFFDKPMIEALKTALQDPSLFQNYWLNTECMSRYLDLWLNHQKSIQVDSLFRVIDQLKNKALPIEQSFPVPTILVYGQNDPVVKHNQQHPLIQKIFPNHQTYIFENSSHFPHIEEITKFISIVSSL